jgi:hypothetical protein
MLDELVNLYPRSTGLPMTVWAGPGDYAHAPRIKVNMAHGNRMNPADTAVVGLLPTPHLIAGSLSAPDLALVFSWIDLNREALLAHWHGDIDGAEMAGRTQKLSD